MLVTGKHVSWGPLGKGGVGRFSCGPHTLPRHLIPLYKAAGFSSLKLADRGKYSIPN